MTEMREARQAERSRQLILDAAVAELAAKNLEAFTVDGVAARAGVDTVVVKQLWPNTVTLLNASLVAFGDRFMPVPDTGTLRGDLLAYAKSFADTVNSPAGRRLLDALLISPKDWDVSGVRPAFHRGRQVRIVVMMHRGIERGECAPDTDPERVLDMLAACLCTPLIFYGREITEGDCEFIVDTLLNGIATRA